MCIATDYDGIFLTEVCGTCICFTNFSNWRNKAIKYNLSFIFAWWNFYWRGVITEMVLLPGGRRGKQSTKLYKIDCKLTAREGQRERGVSDFSTVSNSVPTPKLYL